MFQTSVQSISEFINVLSGIKEENYKMECSLLSGASIGQHTRHIIELYKCLIDGYDAALVCYDSRKRDRRIEQELNFAISQLEQIKISLRKPDKKIYISYELNNKEGILQSNYYREVMYNLEHMIHHEALIKVGINHFENLELPVSFGVAPSTMQYREKCVQ